VTRLERLKDPLGIALLTISAGASNLSLHLDPVPLLWLVEEHGGNSFFARIGQAASVAARAHDADHALVAGSFAGGPTGARNVRIDGGLAIGEAAVCEYGWLCAVRLTSVSVKGPARIIWLNEEGHELEAINHPP